MLALEEIPPNEIEDGEYLVGQPLKSITTNLFSYVPTNCISNQNLLTAVQKNSRQ